MAQIVFSLAPDRIISNLLKFSWNWLQTVHCRHAFCDLQTNKD